MGQATPDYEAESLERPPGREDPPDYRHPFARDYDRLLHAEAFRRLQGKTQVIAPGEADFLRTRLTHTVEVGQHARRLAERLGAHPDCCDAAAIMHDFGHPPFGHIGEEALCAAVDRTAQRWGIDPAEVGGYEGNAQTFRLVTSVLAGPDARPGMNLTRGTLDAVLKYPWFREDVTQPKWCFYPTEAEVGAWVRAGVPDERRYARSFEAQVMDWADDVAYAVHDVEDWYLAGVFPLGMLAQASRARERLVEQIVARGRRRAKETPDGTPIEDPRSDPDEVGRAVEGLFTDPGGAFAAFAELGGEYDGSPEANAALRIMRKRTFEQFTNGVSLADPAAPARRHHNDLHIPHELRLRNDVLRDCIWIYVIDHPRMATYQRGQRRIVDELYEIHADAVAQQPSALGVFPRDVQRHLAGLQEAADRASAVETLRVLADHVGSFTDSQAARLHRRLTGEVDTPFFDFV